MPKWGGDEVWWIAEDDDDGSERPFWQCFVCPVAAEDEDGCTCNADKFEEAKLFSFVDEDTCKLYVANHLYLGDCHPSVKDWDSAHALAQCAIVEQQTQTYDEREKLRSDWRDQQEKKRNG